MINAVRKHLSSIKVKLFLWFWLVTICSIAATRFVSTQLSKEYIEIAIEQKDLRRLTKFSERLHNDQPEDLTAYIKKLARNHKSKIHVNHFVLKPIGSNQIITTFRKRLDVIEHFTRGKNFEHQASWIFPEFKLSGPVKVNIQQQEYLMFYQSRGERTKHLGQIFKQLPMWARIGTPLIVSFIFCWLLARSLSRPLSNIAKVANQLGEGNLSVRVTKDAHRKDELGDLAKSFNQMAGQLESNITAHQRLIGDVSHELRSPLTRLQMALALAQKNQTNGEALTNYIERCELEVGRLDTMIEHVLTLSRLENSAQTLDKQICSLVSLVKPLIDDGNFLGQAKNVEVVLQTTGDPEVIIDQALIASAISNIINNAVKYSPENAQVTLSIFASDEQVTINITDQGQGVAENLLTKLFEPFYRIADARDRASGGTGLGLAIAKQAILAHQGIISAMSG